MSEERQFATTKNERSEECGQYIGNIFVEMIMFRFQNDNFCRGRPPISLTLVIRSSYCRIMTADWAYNTHVIST